MDHEPSFRYGLPVRGIHAVSQVPDASLHAYHVLRWTPADPREAHQGASSVEASGALQPSPSALLRLRGCSTLGGVRSPLRSTWCPVYASPVLFGFHLLHRCNTQYRWLVRPYLAGTYTLQETPSFAWRTNATLQAPPIAAARNERRLLAVACRVEPVVTHPAPPQTRTCAINAYGSSSKAAAARARIPLRHSPLACRGQGW